jgi:hypothetical protein
MTAMRLALVALVAPLALLGCRSDHPPVDIGLAEEPDPVLTENAQQAQLQDMVGTGVTGELTVTPFPDSILVHMSINDAAPETTLGTRAHSGTCENPGPEVLVLASIRTGVLGNGRSQRTLDEQAHRVILDGNHIAAVYAQGAQPGQDRPIACAPIPAAW